MDWLFNTTSGRVLILVIVLVVIRIIAKEVLTWLIRRAISSHKLGFTAEHKRVKTLENIIGTSLSVVLWIFGIIGLLAILGVNLAGLITGAGAIGLVVGIGAQSAIQDFLGGFFILAENQYRVGDIVTLDSVSGSVEDITLRITKLRDLDGNLHFIPNGSIKVVTNKTFDYSNVNINIGIGYGSDIDKVSEIINDVGKELATDKIWGEFIKEPIQFLRIEEFADSSVNIKALGKVTAGKQWDIAGEFRARIKKSFEKNKVEIPFPQRVVHKPKTDK